jgi:hypothetical protein
VIIEAFLGNRVLMRFVPDDPESLIAFLRAGYYFHYSSGFIRDGNVIQWGLKGGRKGRGDMTMLTEWHPSFDEIVNKLRESDIVTGGIPQGMVLRHPI